MHHQKYIYNKYNMDYTTLALAVIAALSELLPLMGFTRANGILHGFKAAVLHIHGQSECYI
jgi:hypothetical protein